MEAIVNVVRSVSLAIAATCLYGCAGLDAEPDGTDEPLSTPAATAEQECHTERARLRILTFNSALAPGFEPLALERAPKVVEALANAAHDVDLMCVQEFWEEAHFNSLRANTAELAHVLRMDPRPGSGECSESELVALAGCLAESCPGASGEQMVGCAMSACATQVAALSGGCLSCIMNHLDGFSECLGNTGAPSDPAVFDGTFDVGLLSRWPIVSSHTRELSAYFVRASVLHARIAVPRFGLVDAYCTHLGSSLRIVPYAGSLGSWEGEHLQQVRETLEFVRNTNQGKRPLVLMGDFNMGPQVGNNSAAWGDQYQLVLDAGLDNAYVAGNNPLCTSCAGTTFRDANATNEIIDHVFSKGLPTWNIQQERLFTDPVDLGQDLPAFHLSDHCGLKLTFSKSRG